MLADHSGPWNLNIVTDTEELEPIVRRTKTTGNSSFLEKCTGNGESSTEAA